MSMPGNSVSARTTLSEDDPIPISLVVHQAFCPRRAWLEVMGEHTDTAQVATGIAEHGGTDDDTTSRTTRLRGIDVRSDRLRICGRCDTLEVGADTAQDLAEAETLVADVRKTVEAGTAPPPLEDDPRCTRCSHVAVCLPDERNLVPVTKRIMVPSPDGQVLHLATPGSRASIRQGRVEVSHRGERVASIPIEQVQAVVAHGNIDLSSGLVRELLWRGIVVTWCSSGGRVVGWAASAASPNGGPRHRQHVEAEHGRLDLARGFVAGKIANQATLLRRHGDHPETVVALRELQRQAEQADSLNGLFGIEGDAAARYFAGFPAMFKADSAAGFHGRTRRPATDPLNAALNYAYALLVADVTRAILACGLDPHTGFLHSPERNKPALALDLCEEFRAPVADSVVLGAFNNGELSGKEFSAVLGPVSLRDKGRKQLIAAYERRVGQEFKHPTYGYAVTWRRAMEIQARMVLGVVDGTQPRYKSIRIR